MVLGPCPLRGQCWAGPQQRWQGWLLVLTQVGRAFMFPQALAETPSTDQCHSPRAWSSCSVPGCVLIQMGSSGSEKLSNLPEDTQLLLGGPE